MMRTSKKLKVKLTDFFLRVFFPQAKNTPEKRRLLATIEFDSILVYSTTALGDYMFNSPILRAIRDRYPAAKIILVASPKYRNFLTLRELYDDVVFWNSKISGVWSLVKKVKKNRPQLAVVLHSHLPYDILSAAMAGCQYILRDNYGHSIDSMARWLVYREQELDEHLIARKMTLVKALGGATDNVNMVLPCRYVTASKPKEKKRIGFQLGASSYERCWPAERYAELARRVCAQNDQVEIVLIGTEQECDLADQFMRHMGTDTADAVINFVGKTTFSQLLGVIASMDLLVTGDTGPLHLAIALGVPTLSLFVIISPRYTGPYQDLQLHECIHIPLGDERITDTETPMKAISVDDVYQRVINKLAH